MNLVLILGPLYLIILLQQEKQKSILSWLILSGLALVWGTSFILIKRGLEVFSSDEVGALRIVITFLVLSPVALTRIRKVSPGNWKTLAIVGVIGSGAPAFLFAMAQRGIDSSLAGILNSLTPLFTVIIGLSFFSLRIRWFNIAGVLIGLAGAVGLISISGGHSFEFNFGYAFFIIIATICYATNVNIVKFRLKEVDPLTITSFSFLLIGLPVVIYLLLATDVISQVTHDQASLRGLGYVTILAVMGTALALIAFNKLVKLASPVFASSVTYLIPLVAVFWGFIDGEDFGWPQVAWMGLILAGIFLVNKKSFRLPV